MENVLKTLSTARVKPINGTRYESVIPVLLEFEASFRAVMTSLRHLGLDASLSYDDILLLMNQDGFAKSYDTLTIAMKKIMTYDPKPSIDTTSPQLTGWNGAFYHAIKRLLFSPGPKVIVDLSDSIEGNIGRCGGDMVRIKYFSIRQVEGTLSIDDLDEPVDLILVNHIFSMRHKSPQLEKALELLRISGHCVGSYMDPVRLKFAELGVLEPVADVVLRDMNTETYSYSIEAATYTVPLIDEMEVWTYYIGRGYRAIIRGVDEYAKVLPSPYSERVKQCPFQRIVEITRCQFTSSLDYQTIFSACKQKFTKRLFTLSDAPFEYKTPTTHPTPLTNTRAWDLLAAASLVTWKTNGVDCTVYITNNRCHVALRGGGKWSCEMLNYDGPDIVLSCDAVRSLKEYPSAVLAPKFLFLNDFADLSPDFATRLARFVQLQRTYPQLSFIRVKKYSNVRDSVTAREYLKKKYSEGLIVQSYALTSTRAPVYSIKRNYSVDAVAQDGYVQTVFGSLCTDLTGVVEVELERIDGVLTPMRVLRARPDKNCGDPDQKQYALVYAVDTERYISLIVSYGYLMHDYVNIAIDFPVIWVLIAQSQVSYSVMTCADDALSFIHTHTRTIKFPDNTPAHIRARAYSARSYLYGLYTDGTLETVRNKIKEEDVLLEDVEFC